MRRSHLSQELANYFDATDTRVREIANTLDAQLLNSAAVPLEEHEARIRREVDSRFLARCPLNIDNRGVYYRVQIPPGVQLNADQDGNPLPPTVTVPVAPFELPLFDDMLPIPSNVVQDASRASVPLASPILASITGAFSPEEAALGVLPVPNSLTFWLEGLPESGLLEVIVTGEPYPRNLWPGRSSQKSETIRMSAEGVWRSTTIWNSVSRVLVYGMAEGIRLDIYALEMGLPQTPDEPRPFTHPAHRDVRYRRFWKPGEDVLLETYYAGSQVGYIQVQSHLLPSPVADVAVEPNTYGLILASGSDLIYADRRERMPDHLDRAALNREPHYGLQVIFDVYQELERRVMLQPQAYADSDSAFQYRFIVEPPNGDPHLFRFVESRQQWEAVTYNEFFWAAGPPPNEVTYPVPEPGTYVFTLETRDSENNIRRDSYPFANLEVEPKAILPTGLSEIRGIGFDHRQQLWAWTGTHLIPLTLEYDGFLFDAESRSVYLTRNYNEVSFG